MAGNKKRLLLTSLLLVPLVALGLYWWRSEKAIYYQLGSQKYKVVRWEVHRGTNLTLASDYKIKQWTRRQLDKVELHLKGSRFDPPFNPQVFSHNPHVIKLLCETGFPPSSSPPANRIDVLGGSNSRKVVRGMFRGPPGHVWFFWAYDASLEPEVILSSNLGSGLRNSAQRQLRIVSKSDNKELLSLPLVE